MFFGAVTIPYFTQLANVNFTQAFFTQSWFQFWIFLMEIPMGVVADKLGRKKSVAIGILLFGVDMFIWSFFPFYNSLLIGEFIGATGFALISGADVSLIYDILKHEKREKQARKVFSRYEIFSGLGRIIGLTLGSLSVGLMIWPYPRNLAFPFFLSGIVMFISFLITFFIKEPKRVTPEENPIQLGILGLKKLFTNKSLRTVSIFFVLFSAFTFFIYWLYQPLVGNVGIEVKYYGLVSGGFNLFGILLLTQTEFISNKIKGRKFFILLTLLSSCLYFSLTAITNPVFVIAGIFFLAGSRAIIIPIFRYFANKKIESKNRATVLSSINMLEKILMVILYPIVGRLMDVSLQTTLIMLGFLTLIIPFFVRIKDEMFD